MAWGSLQGPLFHELRKSDLLGMWMEKSQRQATEGIVGAEEKAGQNKSQSLELEKSFAFYHS